MYEVTKDDLLDRDIKKFNKKMTKRKTYWTITRTTGFIIIGLMNTVLLRPEDIGTWKNYAGYTFLAIAIFDIIYSLVQLRKENK